MKMAQWPVRQTRRIRQRRPGDLFNKWCRRGGRHPGHHLGWL